MSASASRVKRNKTDVRFGAFSTDSAVGVGRSMSASAQKRPKVDSNGLAVRNDPICFSPYLYLARNRAERFFNRIKQCRRLATRYDWLAANDLSFVQLASIRLWLRLNESAP
jgi:transposase